MALLFIAPVENHSGMPGYPISGALFAPDVGQPKISPLRLAAGRDEDK
jgi:hypothetical protein